MNNHVLIGTAGHVDHGKTSLIRALTGINTDRLPSEQKRGLTIDLGFAYIDLPGFGRASIVDVPGHERFVKNMLAGACGIDLVLLVVDSQDSVMPQTREHLDILTLLGCTQGIIVLTKCDRTDADWQDVVEEDVATAVRDTFLAGAPIVRVSAHTGEGLDILVSHITRLALAAPEKGLASPFWLPIDRVFTTPGFGTVVTGTLIEGTLRRDDHAVLLPCGQSARVRGIQTHDTFVDVATPGRRVAINISNIPADSIERGDVLCASDGGVSSSLVNVHLRLLPGSKYSVVQGQRLHLYVGTAVCLARVVLIGQPALLPGQSCMAHFRLDTEVAIRPGLSFVVRFYSPTVTIGGGVILETSPARHRKAHSERALARLGVLHAGGTQAAIIRRVYRDAFVRLCDIANSQDFDASMADLVSAGMVYHIGEYVLEACWYDSAIHQIRSELSAYHTEFPLIPGIEIAKLRARLLPLLSADEFEMLLCSMDDASILVGGLVSLKSFTPTFSQAQRQLMVDILDTLLGAGFSPPDLAALLGADKSARQVLDALLFDGRVVLAASDIAFHCEVIRRARELFCDMAGKKPVLLGEFRDALGCSRKFALTLLEYFDRVQISKKVGDARVVGSKGHINMQD